MSKLQALETLISLLPITDRSSNFVKLAELLKLSDLGPHQATYVADVAANEMKKTVNNEIADEYDDGGHNPMWGRLYRGSANANALTAQSSATQANRPRLTRVLDLLPGDIGGGINDIYGGLAGLTGDPKQVDRRIEDYAKELTPYQEATTYEYSKAEPLPVHRRLASNVAARDVAIAAHTRNRKEKPLSYWLDPTVGTGPVRELIQRMFRRGDAVGADPDAAMRWSTWVPGVSTMRGLLTPGNERRKAQARTITADTMDRALSRQTAAQDELMAYLKGLKGKPKKKDKSQV